MERELQQPELGTVDRSDIVRAMWRHIITLQWSWNYERMQALGYAWSMLPIIEKVYKTEEDQKAALRRHLVFYNTNPQIGSPPIFGAGVALEEQGQGEVVDSLKVGLMGPLAGIGDTIQAILYRPIVAVFAASLAMNGSLGGPLLMVLSGLLFTLLMIPLFWLGYREGMNLVHQIAEGGVVSRVTETATIIGLMVIGAFVPSILARVQTPLEFSRTITVQGQVQEQVVKVQDVLDQILPYMLPILTVALAYWLLRGLKLSPVWTLVVLFVVGFAGSILGVL